ncbi:MAG: hypothetical protein LBC52_05315 [Treponema sp.]|jgi:hypothetical protein|nr:hypothetical protein [Treponema sp.]
MDFVGENGFLNIWLLSKEFKMIVRNLQEKPHSPTCACDNWIEHWERNSGKKADICSAFICSKSAEVGGHVQKRNINDDNWYIIPICKSCNNELGQEYEVKTDTTFISVNETNQCRQKSLIKTIVEASQMGQ